MGTDADSIRLVEAAIADIRKGKMVILTDDEDRENEGDLVMAATKITPSAINFMATHGRGLICLSLTDDRLRQLNLPLMVQDNTAQYQTAFTISIEAARGVTTGISAADRARTVLAAVAPNAKPADLARPGHIFPLRARDGGVLVRTGQTEGSVDLARLAGLFPAGVICEIMNPDGTMARRPELLKFARRHKLKLLSVADLIRYRLSRERLVRRISETTVSNNFGEWRAISFGSEVDPSVHVALIKGDVQGRAPVLTRMHRGCLVGDLLGSSQCDCGSQLQEALRRISQEGRGVVVYLNKDVPVKARLSCTHVSNEEKIPGKKDETRLREFGVGAQILKDLGLSRLRLLTNNKKKIVGLESYDLTVAEQEPLTERAQTQRAARVRRLPRRSSVGQN